VTPDELSWTLWQESVVTGQHYCCGFMPSGYPTHARDPSHSTTCTRQHSSQPGVPTASFGSSAELATSDAATKSPQPPAGTQSPLSARALYSSSEPFGRPYSLQRISLHSASVLNRRGNRLSGDSSVADTEYSQASTLLACLLLASQAGTLSSRCRRHPRRSVHIASASWPSRFWSTPTHSSTLATSLPHG
jgi:hypothetical protein